MNSEQQLKALQQILETLNIAASRQTDLDYKRDGNRYFTTAIQNTKKLMNEVEDQLLLEKELCEVMFGGMDSLSIDNIN